jgi:hypothetical protein
LCLVDLSKIAFIVVCSVHGLRNDCACEQSCCNPAILATVGSEINYMFL